MTLALERDASARRLSYQASHDALTGLANRSLLLTRLSQSLLLARRRGTPLALLFCDLDRFKMVNDSIGHAGGDQLLIEAARRLSGTVRDTDTVARLGGDEFVVLCPELPDRAQAIALAERIRTTLSAPYTIDGKEAFVDASIGITFADESTVSGAELMREADVAMYRAKLTDGSHINVFDSHLEAEVAQRLDLDAALRHAVERDELRLVAQPIVMLDTGVVTGFEVLLQWHRPGLPVLYPGAFIPLAEDNGHDRRDRPLGAAGDHPDAGAVAGRRLGPGPDDVGQRLTPAGPGARVRRGGAAPARRGRAAARVADHRTHRARPDRPAGGPSHAWPGCATPG